MLLCTLGQLLHPVHGFSLCYAQMSGPQIPCARTKASSLSETGDLQGSIWQPGHWASRVDDLKMKNANNASLLQVSWQEWANTIHSFLNVSRSLSPSLALSLSLSLPLCLTHSLICSSPSPLAGRGEVGRRRQDTLFVSQQRTCLAELRFQPRCQTKRHSVQELQDKL